MATTERELVDHADLAVIPPSPISLFGTSEPLAVLDQASKVAFALAKVINKQKLFTVINGKKHVHAEGWTLLGSMLGVFPQIEWTRRIKGEGADYSQDGWEARAVAVVAASGVTVGSADSMCTRQEKMWKDRDDFALRSMAQTRATVRALRGPLGFVIKLAGYAATPAEEVTEDEAK